MNPTIKLLLERMDTNPEEFDQFLSGRRDYGLASPQSSGGTKTPEWDWLLHDLTKSSYVSEHGRIVRPEKRTGPRKTNKVFTKAEIKAVRKKLNSMQHDAIHRQALKCVMGV